MRTLFINLASHDGVLACVDDTRVFEQPVDHRIGDHELIPLLDSLLTRASLAPKDIDRIACIAGPGGFTSLRVAVTFANVLADQLHVPLAGMHLSDLYALRMKTPGAWFHSTKKTHLFVRLPNQEPLLVEAEFLKSIPAGTLWAGELIPDHRSVADAHGLTEADLLPLVDVLPSCTDALLYEKNPLEPWYGRGW